MLISLHVKNLALIDETEVYFGPGLNILTGETGAGKSIIIGSINLALGARADKEMIRTGAEYALIELTFEVKQESQKKMIADLDIPMEDGMLVIQRKIMPTRSVSKVCGEIASSKMLKELAEILIDIHGQHEHQSLFHIKKHMEILDEYAKEELTVWKNKMKEQVQIYHNIKAELEESSLDESTKNREIALADFEVNEIESANIRLGEDIEIEQKYKKLVNSKKIMETVSFVHNITGYDTISGAGESVGRAAKEMKSIIDYDSALLEMDETLNTIDSMLNDFNRFIADYMMDLEFDEADFMILEERLNTLNHLKSKYGFSLEAVKEHQKKQQELLEKLENSELHKKKLQQQVTEVESQMNEICEQITKIRKKYGKKLEAVMTEALLDLNFLSVTFQIKINVKEGVYSHLGNNEVEFLISTNPGEPVKSLNSVASGGELSRIMLALKTVLAQKDEIETLIFDEIDAGISGKTAWKVSEKLAVLGENHQVICITHLPQIAAMADRHFVIAKNAKNAMTTTTIQEISDQNIVEELARLLGGVEMTEAAINNALELKKLADNTKKYNLQ